MGAFSQRQGEGLRRARLRTTTRPAALGGPGARTAATTTARVPATSLSGDISQRQGEGRGGCTGGRGGGRRSARAIGRGPWPPRQRGERPAGAPGQQRRPLQVPASRWRRCPAASLLRVRRRAQAAVPGRASNAGQLAAVGSRVKGQGSRAPALCGIMESQLSRALVPAGRRGTRRMRRRKLAMAALGGVGTSIPAASLSCGIAQRQGEGPPRAPASRQCHSPAVFRNGKERDGTGTPEDDDEGGDLRRGTRAAATTTARVPVASLSGSIAQQKGERRGGVPSSGTV